MVFWCFCDYYFVLLWVGLFVFDWWCLGLALIGFGLGVWCLCDGFRFFCGFLVVLYLSLVAGFLCACFVGG